MKRQFLLYIAVVVTISGCGSNNTSESVITSEDYAFVGDFTQGLEGPAVDPLGNLYFVNPEKNGTIGRISVRNRKLELFIDSLPNGSVANGIRFSSTGNLLLADYINHNILTVDKNTTNITVFANDTSMNQPNDIAIMGNGILFASDPNWANETGNIWKINANGVIMLLEAGMGTTNGIEVAPGDSILYVNESVQRKIWAYDLDEKGNISNKRLLIAFDDFGLDGMRTDVKGNLYVARYGKGVIAIISPEGVLLNEIMLTAKKPTNLAFGGKLGKTVYITCQDRGYIEMFTADFQGRSQAMLP